MEEQTQPAELRVMTPAPESESVPVSESRPPLTNPNLTATLTMELEALKNDFEQANELTSAYQQQLAGKSNELATTKILFEKTKADIAHLQTSIQELRAERHRLANQVMKATALEAKCASLTTERDRLKDHLLALQQSLTAAAEEVTRCVGERESQIEWFTLQLQMLKQQQAAARAVLGMGLAEKPPDPDARLVLATLSDLLSKLMLQTYPPAPGSNSSSAGGGEDVIDIVFTS